MTIQTIAEKYIKELSNKRAERTTIQYDTGLRLFMEYITTENDLGFDDPEDKITKKVILGYPSWVMTRGYKKSSVGVYLAAFRSFIYWMVDQEIIDWDFQTDLKLKNRMKDCMAVHEAKLPNVVPQSEIEKMLDYAKSMEIENVIDARDVALILFLAATGCRNEEVCNLLMNDIDLETNEVRVVGKGRKERITYINPDALAALKSYWSMRPKNHPALPVFTGHNRGASGAERLTTLSVENVINKFKLLCGAEHVTPHKFRHYVATELLKKTNNIALVQQLLGHANIETTRRYTHVTNVELKQAYNDTFGGHS